MAGDLDLAGLAALMAGARLLISGDTGIAHLATAYATPSVVLFGPTSPLRWGPPAGGPSTVIWRGVTGNPHGRWVDPALLDIVSDEVLEAAEARLRLLGSCANTIRIAQRSSQKAQRGLYCHRRELAESGPGQHA